MRSSLGDKARLNHILDAIQELETYLIDADYNSFMNNSMMLSVGNSSKGYSRFKREIHKAN